MPHVRVSWVELPWGIHGRTNGIDLIQLDPGLLQVERRCALAHELTHIHMGHRGHQKPAIELTVRIVTARRLIRFDHLMSARAWAGHSLHEMADELHVTPEVLADRILYLKGEEKHAFDAH